MKDLKEIKKKIHPSPMNVAVIGGGAAGFFSDFGRDGARAAGPRVQEKRGGDLRRGRV